MTERRGRGMSKTDIWRFFDGAKVEAVRLGFPKEQRLDLKKECDDLFRQATGCPVCPGWWIGGW